MIDYNTCPKCGEQAQEKIHVGSSKQLAAGPPIKVCHSSDGAYIHVKQRNND